MADLRRVVYLAASLFATRLFAAAPPEPKLISFNPFAGQRGTAFTVEATGTGLQNASAVFLDRLGPRVTIESITSVPSGNPRQKTPTDVVKLKIETPGDFKAERFSIRLVAPGGVSNALPLAVTDEPVNLEPAGAHETPDEAIVLGSLPANFAGRITRRGETDLYAIDAKAGQTITFTANSGLPSLGAPGGNANGFDPSLTIYEPSGSWFDKHRLNRLAFNDEPLWVIGRLTDAHLTFTFPRAGRFYLRLEAFSGQGGMDYSYFLRAVDGDVPPKESRSGGWDERSFTRTLTSDRLNRIAARAGKPTNQRSAETYRGQPVPAASAPLVKLPANVEGALVNPGETHRARFHIDKPLDLAIEVETPSLGPPVFNPIVRVMNPKGEEVATNVFAGRGACTGALNKGLQAKAVLPLRDIGEYTVEMRDTTSDLAEPGFQYRVMLRPQMPHLGQVKIDADHLNLRQGDAQTVRVNFDREEDYRGAVVVLPEGLPAGVQAVAGADFEPDKDPPAYPGKRERYVPRTERSVVVFTASSDAPVSAAPQVVKLVVRPVVDGKPGEVIASKEIPLMVLAKP
ncbi:MAG: hypothetical protein IT168_13465 [Bryobacterales bacterium]|nr:hypothetical protein [Bryobacterales bacterium]